MNSITLRDIFLLLNYPWYLAAFIAAKFPNVHNSQFWTRPMPRVRNSIWVYHICRRAYVFLICFSGTWTRSWVGSRAARTQASIPIWDTGLVNGVLICWARMLVPTSHFFLEDAISIPEIWPAVFQFLISNLILSDSGFDKRRQKDIL